MQKERLEQLFDFLKNVPNDSFLKFAIALEYIKKDNDEKALEYFLNIVQNDPNYIGVYYHLGKLYERIGKNQDAEKIYQSGMQITKQKNELHTYSELQEAYNQLKDYTG